MKGVVTVIEVHTDGACRNNQQDENIGAWGAVVVLDDGREFSFRGSATNTTNNIMEMQAVVEALSRLTNRLHMDIEIYSDSAYVVNCFNQKWYAGWRRKGWKNSKGKPVANRELWEELINLVEMRTGNTTWIKVKGHSGDHYNEMADTLCNEAMDELERIM